MRGLEKKVSFGKNLAYIGVMTLAALCSSCGVVEGLRGRTASAPSLGPFTSFLGLKNLGLHGSGSEGNGHVYCCEAGQIDVGHARNGADRARYTGEKIEKHLMENKKDEFVERKFSEPALYIMKFNYPENWENLPLDQKKQIAYDISVKLGGHLAYTSETWHEVITWFGYSKFFTDFPSAFTWEDNFSNIFGTYLGVQVLQDIQTFDQETFDEALTLALNKELEGLDIQSKKFARHAVKKVSGSWFSGLFGFNVKKRHFDIGLDDGYVTPFLIPGLPECEGAEAKAYPVHSLDFLSEYGFSVKFEIEVGAKKSKIMKIVYPGEEKGKKRIEPDKHFAKIIDYIKRDAVRRYGVNVDVPGE